MLTDKYATIFQHMKLLNYLFLDVSMLSKSIGTSEECFKRSVNVVKKEAIICIILSFKNRKKAEIFLQVTHVAIRAEY